MDSNKAFLTSRLSSQPQSLRPYSIFQTPDHNCNTSATPCIAPFPRSLIQIRRYAAGSVQVFAARALAAFASHARHAQLERDLISARLDRLEDRQARTQALEEYKARLEREGEELRRELDSRRGRK